MKKRILELLPMLPFLVYVRPYRNKIVLAIVFLFFMGFLGPFSILMMKPALDVIFTVHQQRGGGGTVLADGSVEGDVAPLALSVAGDAPSPEQAAAAEKAAGGPSIPNPLIGVQERLQALGMRWFGTWKAKYENLARESPFKALLAIAFVVIAATVLRGAFEYGSNYLMTHAMGCATVDLQVDIFRRVLTQDYLFFKKQTTGYLISRIGSDVQLIRITTMNLIRDGLQQPVTLFFLLLLLIYLSPAMTFLAVLILPVGGVILYKFAHKMRKITSKSRKKGDELSSMLEESLRNYPLVKIFGTEEFEIRRFRRQSWKIFELSMKGRAIRFGTGPLMESLGAVSLGGVLLLGAYLVLYRGTLDASAFIAYLVALTQFYYPIKRLSRMNVRFQEAVISAERLHEMLSMTPRVTTDPGAVEPAEFRHGIRLENVTFGYVEETILKNISLELQRGEMVALVGPSGAGKTTLLGLLPRLYDPWEGRILLDGIELNKIDLHRLRQLFGVVTQETVLFNDSIFGNITYGTPGAIDRQRVETCAQAANAHEFILGLEQGYDTVIGQSGARLSGGQAQRIAIARALYRDPPILLLDEATSHLDARSEALVQEAIDRLLEGRTAVVIAHRLSTVRRANRIVFLEDGRVVEQGTHEELMEKVELYRNLYALQSLA